MVIMLIFPAWALLWNMFNPETGWWFQKKYLLLTIGLAVQGLQIWIIAEGILIWNKAKGNYPELEPLPAN